MGRCLRALAGQVQKPPAALAAPRHFAQTQLQPAACPARHPQGELRLPRTKPAVVQRVYFFSSPFLPEKKKKKKMHSSASLHPLTCYCFMPEQTAPQLNKHLGAAAGPYRTVPAGGHVPPAPQPRRSPPSPARCRRCCPASSCPSWPWGWCVPTRPSPTPAPHSPRPSWTTRPWLG